MRIGLLGLFGLGAGPRNLCCRDIDADQVPWKPDVLTSDGPGLGPDDSKSNHNRQETKVMLTAPDSTRTQRTRVFVAEDHPVFRAALMALLGAQTDLQVVGDATTQDEAVAGILATRPDLALLDMTLASGTGIGVCEAIRAARSDVRCALLTGDETRRIAGAAALAGAVACLSKGALGNHLIDSIRKLAAAPSSFDLSA